MLGLGRVDMPVQRIFVNKQFSYNLRDYYIKTAYNCCTAGEYKNDFVNVCALKNCIRQGARCLDFEIYSVKGSPVVAAGPGLRGNATAAAS